MKLDLKDNNFIRINKLKNLIKTSFEQDQKILTFSITQCNLNTGRIIESEVLMPKNQILFKFSD